MSRNFQSKNKDLVNLRVVSAKDVWQKNRNGSYSYRKDMQVFGKVDKGTSAFVTNTNNRGTNNRFIEDTSKLPKRVKNDIVKQLYQSPKTRVAYLVVEENTRKGTKK